MVGEAYIPSWKEGGCALLIKWRATLARAQTGGQKFLRSVVSDLPRHAEAKVALHLFDRRTDPPYWRGF